MGNLHITLYQKYLANGAPERPEVSACLRESGHHVREMDDGVENGWEGTDLLWLQGNANWFPHVCRQLEQAGAKRPRTIVWHTEPLPPRPDSGLWSSRLHLREIAKIVLRDRRATDPCTNAARVGRLRRFGLPDVLIVSSRSRQEFLASRGIASHFVPFGYHPETHGRLLRMHRDVDVLFLGTMQVPRRRRLVVQLRKSGILLQTEGNWKSCATWGENRTHLLNRTKVLLNLQRHPGEFSGMRMILGMGNGAMVISEPIDLPDPYVPNQHYIETPAVQMPNVIHHYLKHPDERERIVAEAYRLVTEKLTMQTSVQNILEIADLKNIEARHF